MSGAGENGGPVLWEELSAYQLGELVNGGMDMAVLPIGSTEQHAAHLPVNVDMLCCYEIAKGVSRATGVPVLPPLGYGNSLAHAGWPGTVSLRPDTFMRVLEELCGWVLRSGFRKIVILNGHLGNEQPMGLASSTFRFEHPEARIKAISWWDITPEIKQAVVADVKGWGFHANDAETSMMLYLRPDLVRMEEARDETEASRDMFFRYFLRERTRTGATGNPLLATREKGERLYRMAVEALAAQIKQAFNEEPPLGQGF